MKTPKYTDLHRYPRGYTKETDIERTFDRIRRERAAKAKSDAEAMRNVEQLPKRTARNG